MKMSHGVGDGWKNIVQINVVEICNFEVVFFSRALFFILTRAFLKLRTCLFLKAFNRRKHPRIILT